jgi:hypothetical protein
MLRLLTASLKEFNITYVGARQMVAPALLRSILDDQKMATESTGFLMAKSRPYRARDLLGYICSR